MQGDIKIIQSKAPRIQIEVELDDNQTLRLALNTHEEGKTGVFLNWHHPVRVGSYDDGHTNLVMVKLDHTDREVIQIDD